MNDKNSRNRALRQNENDTRSVGREYIDSKIWNRIVPPSYVNHDWLSSGDSLFDGNTVRDDSDLVPYKDREDAAMLLDARTTVFNMIDSDLRRRLWDYHVWFTDPQRTFVADFPRLEPDSNIRNDYRTAKAMLTVIRPVLESSYIRDCPFVGVKKLITGFDEVLEDLVGICGSDAPDLIQPEFNDTWFMRHGPWFVTVAINESGVPVYDVIGSRSLNEARWRCEEIAEASGLPLDCCIALGPYASPEDAMYAKDYYSGIPMGGLTGAEYLERLESLFDRIRKHDFTGMDS